MIVVIADDFTGAAEMSGIGLRYGLTVQLAMPGVEYTGADLFVVCTDSRSMHKMDAEKITAEVVADVVSMEPELLYKKIDSVLRGHVLEELTIQVELMGLSKAFVLPANPSLGRTIKEGDYYVEGKAISETGFANDPEFAITDSSVLKMMKAASGEERVMRHADDLPEHGIVVGEAETIEEVAAWTGKLDEQWALAGAGDFFTALLDSRYEPTEPTPIKLALPHLYVSGTAFDKSRAYIKDVQNRRGCVAYLSEAILETGNANDNIWLDKVDEILAKQQRCIIAIDGDRKWNIPAMDLRAIMAGAVKMITEKAEIKELFIEGGSTAAAILSELDIKSLVPETELQRGVVRMKAKEWYITVKPGSYELPGQVKELY